MVEGKSDVACVIIILAKGAGKFSLSESIYTQNSVINKTLRRKHFSRGQSTTKKKAADVSLKARDPDFNALSPGCVATTQRKQSRR